MEWDLNQKRKRMNLNLGNQSSITLEYFSDLLTIMKSEKPCIVVKANASETTVIITAIDCSVGYEFRKVAGRPEEPNQYTVTRIHS